MESKIINEIVPAAEGNDVVQAVELAEAVAGETKPSETVHEEATPTTVVVTDEKEAAVADHEQKQELTPVAVASGGAEVAVMVDEQKPVTMAVTVASFSSGGEGSSKKPRGRPRKDEDEDFMGMIEFSPTQKRGRGRPKGTGKLQRLAMAASLGGDANANVNAYAETGGSNFTAHIITVQKGENIVERIRSFCESTTDSVCIISACGTVSIADLYVSLPGPGILRYEGELSIVTLNGSHTYNKNMAGKVFVMSVQLAYPDSRLCGGAVAASLIAATPTQIVMGTFKQNRQPKGAQHKSGGASGSKGGMRLVAVAERVDSGQPTLAQPIGSAQV